MYVILSIGIVMKAALFIYCRAANKVADSDTLEVKRSEIFFSPFDSLSNFSHICEFLGSR